MSNVSAAAILPSWETVLKFIQELGWVKGTFALFFFMAHAWIYGQYKGRLNDRQKEIDRIAAENREYRERFLRLFDEKLGYKTPKAPKAKGGTP